MNAYKPYYCQIALRYGPNTHCSMRETSQCVPCRREEHRQARQDLALHGIGAAVRKSLYERGMLAPNYPVPATEELGAYYHNALWYMTTIAD